VLKEFGSRQFLAFLLTGGIAAIVNFGSRIAYSHWVNFSSAIVLAYCTGMLVAFCLARVFVFTQSTRALGHSAGLFVLVNALAVLQTWVVSMVLATYLLPAIGVTMYAQAMAHAVGVAVPVFTSYWGHKRWTFR
jgi:putative flippase GtrA